MSNDWLAAASFENAYDVLSAINTLSIHAKLVVANADDPTPADDIVKARSRLAVFLQSLSRVIKDASERNQGAVVGADPRLGQIARHYLVKQTGHGRAMAIRDGLEELPALVASDKKAQLRQAIPLLNELRSVVEEQVEQAATEIIGDVR